MGLRGERVTLHVVHSERVAHHREQVAFGRERVSFHGEHVAFRRERVGFRSEQAASRGERVAFDSERAALGRERVCPFKLGERRRSSPSDLKSVFFFPIYDFYQRILLKATITGRVKTHRSGRVGSGRVTLFDPDPTREISKTPHPTRPGPARPGGRVMTREQPW